MPQVQSWDYEVYDAGETDDIDKIVDDLRALGRKGWNIAGVLTDDLLVLKMPIDGIRAYTGEEIPRRERPNRRRRKNIEEIDK